ncbi:hypothetical protein SAMN05445850_7015 [Paraburkholderia tuberum]|uniref:Uncharacterized protein n=1 Tax=Paraburkholderia tuberum TaxID=157910 RepID=A0A1H1KCG2_9BURK|nr:hypothetical protein SAMN05445850_7015 [Paraburkholderia tuberum]
MRIFLIFVGPMSLSTLLADLAAHIQTEQFRHSLLAILNIPRRSNVVANPRYPASQFGDLYHQLVANQARSGTESDCATT